MNRGPSNSNRGCMPNLQNTVTRKLFALAATTKYPSSQVLDRLEASLHSRQDFRDYAELLLRLMANQCYPSLRLLDRLEMVALWHDGVLEPGDSC